MESLNKFRVILTQRLLSRISIVLLSLFALSQIGQ